MFRKQPGWPGESSGAGTASFRCNITNYYFYFRFIAFVNCDSLAELPGTRLHRLPESQMVKHQVERQKERLFMIARRQEIALIAATLGMALGFIFLLVGCSKLPKSPLQLPLKTATAKPEPTQPSTINVEVKDGGPVVVTTSAAEFQV